MIHEESDDIGKRHYPQEFLILVLHRGDMDFLCPHLDEELVGWVGVVDMDDITDQVRFVQFPVTLPILRKSEDIRQMDERPN